jgi:hypothetical protein
MALGGELFKVYSGSIENPPPMKTPRSFLLHPVVCMILLLVAPAYGQTVVHWGDSPDYVTGSANFAFSGSNTNGNVWRSGAPQNVSPFVGYSAPSGRTGDIFAVFQQETTSATKTYAALMVANGLTVVDNDYIRMQGQNSSTISGLIYFTKTGFLNGFSSGALSLTSVEEIKLTISSVSSAADSAVLRPAVLNGTDWFLSSSFSIDFSAGTRTFGDFSSSTWAAWDPTQFPLPTAPGLYGTASETLTDIQAFGFYYNVQRGSAPRLNVSGFEVTAVPEPKTVTLLLAGVGLWAARYFKRRRRLS